MTCGRAQEFLARNKVETSSMADAKKETRGAADALALARQAEVIYAVKGKKVVRIDMAADRPDAATLKGLILGPTGNLRAPTIRVGATLLIGFDEETFRKVLR